MLDLHTLRVFKAVLQTGSVSAAADVMNTVQSNVTQRLKKLESNIGCKLFERSKKGMVPTRMGHLLSQHADRILAAVQLAEQSLAVALQRQQQIRIVSMQTTAAVRLPNVLVRYYKTFPKMHLQMVTCDSQTAFQKILDGQADVGFVSGYERHPSLCQIPVFHEELVLITPKGVSLDDFMNNPTVLSLRPGCHYRYILERWARAHMNISPDFLEVGSFDGILGCVAGGMGVTILPKSTVCNPASVRAVHANIDFHSLSNDISHATTYAIYKKDSPLISEIAALVEMCSGTTE